MKHPSTVSEYLISRLADYGVGHVFGVPGDYVLQFYQQLENSPLRVINTCDEQGAGFAADAYARLRGLRRGLRHLLRRWAKSRQYHRSGLCREIAAGGDQRFSGPERAPQKSPCCTIKCAISIPNSIFSGISPWLPPT